MTTEGGKVEQALELISGMTVLELSELVKAAQEKFGVSAAAPMGMMMGPAAAAAPAEEVEEKTQFNVVLKSAGDQKIQVIKVVRAHTTLGLKEAKALVDGAPATVKEGVSKEEAEKIKAELGAVGGQAELT